MCASVKRRHRHAACGDSDGGLFQRKTWKAEQASELQFIPAARLKHLDCSSHFLRPHLKCQHGLQLRHHRQRGLRHRVWHA
eukprot:157745-Rhodomonas_salina.2